MGQLRANGKDVAHAAEEGNIIVINTCGLLTMQKQNQ
jgi:tRNA A37 methylthiotransferase MiaB